MSDKEICIALCSWYRAAIDGNPFPMDSVYSAIETLHIFGLVSNEIYDFASYLMENLIEIDRLELPFPAAPEDMDEEVLPFA